MENYTSTEIKKKKKWVIPVAIASAILLFAAIASIIVIVGIVAVPKARIKKQLELGEKYITEMDYENAVLAYREAIQIDPRNEEAYIGLAEAYEEWAEQCIDEGNTDKAVKIFDCAIRDLGTARENNIESVVDKIEDMEEKKKTVIVEVPSEKPVEITDETEEEIEQENVPEEFKTVDIADVPDGLESFLNGLNYTWDFDCESEESVDHLVQNMLRIPDTVCSFSTYQDHNAEPKEYSHQEALNVAPNYDVADGSGCYCYDAYNVDWILKNIYNLDDSMINKIKDPTFFKLKSYYYTPDNVIYYEDGKYWVISPGGMGLNAWLVNIKSIEASGNRYHIDYQLLPHPDFAPEFTISSPIDLYADMEYKTLDGNGYWTVYKNITK